MRHLRESSALPTGSSTQHQQTTSLRQLRVSAGSRTAYAPPLARVCQYRTWRRARVRPYGGRWYYAPRPSAYVSSGVGVGKYTRWYQVSSGLGVEGQRVVGRA
eukprot:310815-Rhodomonas_salina.1